MGKVCPLCKRDQPKWAYKEAGGKVNAKKKKGKAAACNDCKAARGNCVKLLSPAGFILAGIPEHYFQAYVNGIYSKTEQIVNSRHVYSGPNGVNAWHFNSEWRVAGVQTMLEPAYVVHMCPLWQLHPTPSATVVCGKYTKCRRTGWPMSQCEGSPSLL